MKKEKKEYNIPEFKIKSINFLEDTLSASTPGGGSWGYFDEDPTTSGETPYDPGDDFWD